MKCPFLEEVTMSYCRAFPIKKLVPSSSLHAGSVCESGFASCSAYKQFSGMAAAHQETVAGSHGTSRPIRPDRPCASCTDRTSGQTSQDESQKYCVWQEQDIVSYRICTKNYECEKCQFEQMLADTNGKYVEPPEVVQEVERLRSMPTSQRRCKYVITGKVLTKLCTYNYECFRCPAYNTIRDTIAAKSGTM
jgi:hypothetical protein